MTLLIILIYLICFIVFYIDDEKGSALIGYFSYPLTIYWILGMLLENIVLGINSILLIPFVVVWISVKIGVFLARIDS